MAGRGDMKVLCAGCRYPNPYWERVCALCGQILAGAKPLAALPGPRGAPGAPAAPAARSAPAPPPRRRALPADIFEPERVAPADAEVQALLREIRSGTGYYVTCFLYSVPFPLRKEKPIRIGRGPDNDVVLPSDLVSRHHAEIRPANGAPLVVDLGSRNGTLLGEKKVLEAPLQEGSRIRVGPFYLVLRRYIPGETRKIKKDRSALLEKSTVDAGFFEEVTALEGELSQMAPRDVLRILGESRKTGVLEIRAPEGEARVVVVEGEPRDARLGAEKGMGAFRRILALRDGDFRFGTSMTRSARNLEAAAVREALGDGEDAGAGGDVGTDAREAPEG
ncbi:MAG: FHA domain-containing protein [Planctomycetales bacterium]|nr:FHA domain-containing protein [Planctomycetales bacterium]